MRTLLGFSRLRYGNNTALTLMGRPKFPTRLARFFIRLFSPNFDRVVDSVRHTAFPYRFLAKRRLSSLSAIPTDLRIIPFSFRVTIAGNISLQTEGNIYYKIKTAPSLIYDTLNFSVPDPEIVKTASLSDKNGINLTTLRKLEQLIEDQTRVFLSNLLLKWNRPGIDALRDSLMIYPEFIPHPEQEGILNPDPEYFTPRRFPINTVNEFRTVFNILRILDIEVLIIDLLSVQPISLVRPTRP